MTCDGFSKFLVKITALLCLWLFPYVLVGQEMLVNLQNQYENTFPGTNKRYEVAGKYAQILFFNDQKAKAFTILQDNIETAKVASDGKYAAYLYSILAMNYRLQEDQHASADAIRKAISFSEQTKDLEIKGYVSYCQGWLHVRNSREPTAVKAFLNAAKYYEQAPPSATLLSRLSVVYKELSSIYANWDDAELHVKYSKLTLHVAIKQGDANAIFEAYMGMGYMYEQQFVEKPDQQSLRDLAEKYYLQAIQTYQKNVNNIAIPSNLSFVANNLANLYFRFYPDSYRDKAMFYANMAKDIGIETNEVNHVASAYGIMAEMALEKNDAKGAKMYLLLALSKINESSIVDQNIALSIYQSLSRVSEMEGNYWEALGFSKHASEIYKAIYDQDKMSMSKRLESQFEKERQEQKMLRLQLEADKREQQIKLMEILGIQQDQELVNLKLNEKYQRNKLELAELESEKRAQELQLSRLETQNKEKDIQSYKNELLYKERINKFYVLLISAFAIFLGLMVYAYRQTKSSLRQRERVHNLEMEKEKQNSNILTLTALLKGQEQERGRLARDLHDGLGGLLSGTKLQLTHLYDKITGIEQSEMEKSIAQLDGAVDELRRVAHNLMPDLLVKYGLQEALNEYAIRMSNDLLDIDVQFLSYTQSLSKEKELLLYRIVQELVNNAIKHANATEIIIQLVEAETNYTVLVEDDGKGFDTANVALNKSAGMHNIESRVQFLNGTMTVHSEVNLGTSIEFQFPKI